MIAPTIISPAYGNLAALTVAVLDYYQARGPVPLAVAQMLPCVGEALASHDDSHIELIYALFSYALKDILDSKQTRPLGAIVNDSQRRFGELLREVCEVAGITQSVLARKAKRECGRLIEIGEICIDSPIGSMEQQTLSKVMAGIQEPTYYQVYIWLKVLREHYESAQFAEICKKLQIELPKFKKELEQQLWRLAGFVPPEERHQVYVMTKNTKLIEIYPQTNPAMS